MRNELAGLNGAGPQTETARLIFVSQKKKRLVTDGNQLCQIHCSSTAQGIDSFQILSQLNSTSSKLKRTIKPQFQKQPPHFMDKWGQHNEVVKAVLKIHHLHWCITQSRKPHARARAVVQRDERYGWNRLQEKYIWVIVKYV